LKKEETKTRKKDNGSPNKSMKREMKGGRDRKGY
jgi:hypothetical protein